MIDGTSLCNRNNLSDRNHYHYAKLLKKPPRKEMTQTLDLLLLISFIFLGIPFMYQFSLYLGNRLREFLWKKKKRK